MARQHPFLMHALLALSALHLAHDVPSKRQQYLLVSRSHQDIAMPLFRHAIEKITSSSCHAIMAFAHFLVIYSLGADDGDESLLLADPSSPHPQSMCYWLYFIRNGCMVVCDYWDLVEKGPLGPLIEAWDAAIPSADESNIVETTVTNRLLSLVPSTKSGGDNEPWSSDISKVYFDAAVQLGQAFGATQALSLNDFTTWDAVRFWPMEISGEYLELLSCGHPAALILLAHYCLLLQRLEPHWYFGERVTRLLASIMQKLGPRWHDSVQASIDDVGSALRRVTG